MNFVSITLACFISLFVSAIGVSIGGTSLVTVPLLIMLGMASKDAVATNMFALIFLSISGAVGFRKEMKPTHYTMVVIFSILTMAGSFVGANLIQAVDESIVKKIIAIMVCVIAGSFLFKKDLGIHDREERISKIKFFVGALSILILGIYGGFFSGGYVTLLSYVLILIFGIQLLQAAFITKILNIFSSLVACIFFYYHGLIDFSVGIPLAFSMSLGAFLGAKLAVAKGNLWVRNMFILAAILLAIKLLVF